MKHPMVDVDVAVFEPLLSPTAIAELEREYWCYADRFCKLLFKLVSDYSYTDKTRQALMEYAGRMIEADIQDWYRNQIPDADVGGRYHTAVAVLLFQMLDQNVGHPWT